MQQLDYDLAIIGGGLVGCAIARDAAGRGLSVFLCEQNDLASGASCATLKLVHGGPHHLAHGSFSALRRDLRERQTLWRAAPHLLRPLRFLLPHHDRMWPRWAIAAGLSAYDRLRRSSLPSHRRIDLRSEAAGGELQSHFETAFAFSDCLADDARLAIANAIDAKAHGARIETRLRCVVAERDGSIWRLSLESVGPDRRFSVCARALVNATGAAVAETADHVIHASQLNPVRLRKSMAIYVRRKGLGEDAYALPNADGRIVYAMPFSKTLTLIGAQREGYRGDPYGTAVTPRDVAYLCDALSQYFALPPGPEDVVFAEASLAALPQNKDPDRQDSAIVADAPPRLAPVYSILGGTLTSHRWLAERAVDSIGRTIKVDRPWTADSPLPGGGLPAGGLDDLAAAITSAYPFLGSLHAARLVATYGSRAAEVLSGARRVEDLGMWFGGYLTEREVAFLRDEEWARTAEDVMRRTRFGLKLDKRGRRQLEDWFDRQDPIPSEAAEPAAA